MSCRTSSYAANGTFVGDFKMLLEAEGFAGLEVQRLEVRPRAGASMTCFGWEPDGSVVNSTYAFAMSCIIAYCVCLNCDMPQPLVQLLQSIPVRFTKYDSTENRVLQSLVESAIARHANRTVQCPLFLAEELKRCTFQPQYVKAFVKLYQQRMSLKPALQYTYEDVRKSYEVVDSSCGEVHVARWPLGCGASNVLILSHWFNIEQQHT